MCRYSVAIQSEHILLCNVVKRTASPITIPPFQQRINGNLCCENIKTQWVLQIFEKL